MERHQDQNHVPKASKGIANQPNDSVETEGLWFSPPPLQLSAQTIQQSEGEENTAEVAEAGQGQSWAERYQAFQTALQNGPVSTRMMGHMFMDAIRDVEIPAPLQARQPIPADLNFVARVNRSEGIHATTSPRDAFNNPDNYWRWMYFTPRTISETRAYTKSTIEHELHHCADLQRDLDAFHQGEGPKTEDAFIEFAQNNSLSHGHHMDVYYEQANPEDFAQWSQAERISWLQGALMEMPPNLRASDPLPIERRIHRFYETASEQRKAVIFRELYRLVYDLSDDNTTEQFAYEHGRAVTALTHFRQIWDATPNNQRFRRNLIQIVRDNMPNSG